MKRSHMVGALLAGSAIFLSSAAWAQVPEAQPDASDATHDTMPISKPARGGVTVRAVASRAIRGAAATAARSACSAAAW